jgi:hypothetical protein
MSDDIKSALERAKEIGAGIENDSNALRHAVRAIAKHIVAVAEITGVAYSGGPEWSWQISIDDCFNAEAEGRCEVRRENGKWTVGLHEVLSSRNQDSFEAGNEEEHKPVERLSRARLMDFVEHIEAFMAAYVAELERRHTKIMHARQAAEKVSAALKD